MMRVHMTRHFSLTKLREKRMALYKDAAMIGIAHDVGSNAQKRNTGGLLSVLVRFLKRVSYIYSR